MKKCFTFLVSFAFAASSQDIVLSKDSLRVINGRKIPGELIGVNLMRVRHRLYKLEINE
jgi:hypothetical protein